jgi:phospholipid/cholesterol/gamma-HCH transport system ATP-binding protein
LSHFVLEDVYFQRNNAPLLDTINLDIPSGKSTVIWGPSGSGKSLLLKCMSGIFEPSWGRVLIDGYNIGGISEKRNNQMRKSWGFVFQSSALWANKTVYQNLALPVEYHIPKVTKVELNKKIVRICKRLGITEDLNLRPSQLSRGEQKLVSIARALILDPETIFFDSPLTELDRQGRKLVRDLIIQLAKEQKTLVVASYDTDLAAQITEYLVVLDEGRIITQGYFEELARSEDALIQRAIADLMDESASYSDSILDILDDTIEEGFNDTE